MKRASFSTAAAAMLSAIGSFGLRRGGIHRFSSDNRMGRSMIGAKTPSRSRSKYVPHMGTKERERAKRCYMERTHGIYGPLRSAPVMLQMSKREYQMRLDAELTARAG